MSAVTKGDAALFRAFHTMVPEDIREQMYSEIMSINLTGHYDGPDRLAQLVLAYVASGKIPPRAGEVCRDILALILHSTTTQRLSSAAKRDSGLAMNVNKAIEESKRKLKKLENAATQEAAMLQDKPVVTLDDLEATVTVAVEEG